MIEHPELRRHDAVSPSTLQLRRTAKDVGTAYARTVSAQRERDGAYDALIAKLHAVTALRHGETGQHIERVGALAAHLAKLAGQSIQYCATMRRAAPLHDVGKILIPDHILRKAAGLSDSERAVMAMHVEAGVLLLDGTAHPVLAMAKEIAQCHHERWDGTGYPQQLHTTDIPLCARITAIVDVFDAVSNDRVYRPAMPMCDVIELIRKGRGTHFDPQLATKLLDRIDEFTALQDLVDRESEKSGAASQSPLTALKMRMEGC
ncbi:HD-GYP domain-containing protein [Achromobacter mucicolens]|uniref:HD-GYP domain-containing protein n=1 Tax=Achromobacter mucicolens TaxID=1389922 RepID=UPI000AD1D26B|nr:HD domain-containing phosphohydrolase [Achromobacter mucicolens]MDH1525114.1 HD domain-containing protein [Achromobacter mucicolens]UAN01822.1 HD domain-containing protein [Achromobacter mucicolens]